MNSPLGLPTCPCSPPREPAGSQARDSADPSPLRGAPPTSLPSQEHHIESHRTASFIPPLDEDDLNALAHDIRENGLLQAIVLDHHGRILDGRGRLAACKQVGTEPHFTTYGGDAPDVYVLSVNLRRRNLTKGQTAMITIKARSASEQHHRSDTEHTTRSEKGHTTRSLGKQLGVAAAVLGRASIVLQHAPDLVNPVISGAMGLDEAYATARENKAKATSAEAQLTRLREEDAELADRVVEGDLTLAGAWAERTARVEEDKRERRVATRLLDEVVLPLAQARGTRTFSRYDPAYASGTPITRETIAHAVTALAEMDQVWQARALP
ncbi:ParB N-terminal domain-containing protein [Streptomyces albipurpureus]|uniref:ParB/RepB/Spo0J family partition protein n=1 Tax=Streptomyces albipurpureus TaxID=2897419 RepID=A0ABT0UWN3_9ACTN|nr:ParB/RepB/Spo0J family partition protein [Streptomyces sp. CWNU-1]MCM2392050.1 ParB/RepB/Spo0J family partition protein [Streptomyces sp. CWNU-1]